MGLLEETDDHTPITSSGVLVCKECGGEWPCLAMFFKAKFERLEYALIRIRDLDPATSKELEALFGKRTVITHAAAIAYEALGGDEIGPDRDDVGSPTLDRFRDERDQARAERDAANAQAAKLAAELERLDKAREATAEDFGALECRVLEMRAERDRARDAAAALEAENAILRPAVDEVTRARADAARATGPDPWAEAAELREFGRWIGDNRWPAQMTEAEIVDAIQERAAAVLARTDPLRADAEGGEDRD